MDQDTSPEPEVKSFRRSAHTYKSTFTRDGYCLLVSSLPKGLHIWVCMAFLKVYYGETRTLIWKRSFPFSSVKFPSPTRKFFFNISSCSNRFYWNKKIMVTNPLRAQPSSIMATKAKMSKANFAFNY